MNLKTNLFPAELLLRLSGVNGYKPMHPLECPGIAELIKDYYNQISNLQREVITLTQERGMLEQENKFFDCTDAGGRMKVYAAAWWDNYYPIPDNVGGVFSNDRDAYIFLDKKRQEHREKLSEYDCYRVFIYEVEDALK